MFGFLLCCPALLIACYAVGNDDVILLQSIQQRYSTIQYVSDEALYGQKEYWATPNETLSRWQGDCEGLCCLIQREDMPVPSRLIFKRYTEFQAYQVL